MIRLTFAAFALMIAAILGSGCSTAAASPDSALSDSEILGVLTRANQVEIEQGTLGTTQAASQEVRDFARVLVSDHEIANQRALEVSSAHGVTSTESPLSLQLQTNASRSLEVLRTWRGSGFDRTFIDLQVKQHQWLLDTIDANLMPSARNRGLRELLEWQRGSVASHLARARQIRGGL